VLYANKLCNNNHFSRCLAIRIISRSRNLILILDKSPSLQFQDRTISLSNQHWLKFKANIFCPFEVFLIFCIEMGSEVEQQQQQQHSFELSGNEKMSGLYSRIHQEAEKLQKWKTAVVTELKEKVR